MDKLDHLGWVVSRSFEIGDVRFAVRSTSHTFGDWLSEVLGAYEVDDVEDFLYSVVVPEPPADGRAREFFILYKGDSAIVRTLDPATLGRSLLSEVEGHQLRNRDDAVYLMASVAVVGGEPVLIPTSLGPGLAKLGRRAVKLGIDVPGQFAIGIDLDSATVIPLRPTLDLRGDPLEPLTSKFPWRAHDGLKFVMEPEDVRALLIPAREPELTVQAARKGYALANLTALTLNLEQTGGRGLQTLGRFVERTSCFEASWTNTADVITGFAAALKESP